MDFKFDHVHLVCGDAEGMLSFFERVFGAERISFNPDFKGAPSGVLLLGSMRIFVRGVKSDEKPDAVAPVRVQGLDHFGIEDESLRHVARIVRGADTARLDLEPECAGLLALSLGFSALHGDDQIALEHAIALYDGLYSWVRHARKETHNWPTKRAAA